MRNYPIFQTNCFFLLFKSTDCITSYLIRVVLTFDHLCQHSFTFSNPQKNKENSFGTKDIFELNTFCVFYVIWVLKDFFGRQLASGHRTMKKLYERRWHFVHEPNLRDHMFNMSIWNCIQKSLYSKIKIFLEKFPSLYKRTKTQKNKYMHK